MLTAYWSIRFRATRFHASGGGAPCQKIAMGVCSGVRLVLFIEPSPLTSLKASAYAVLVSAVGPSVRNLDELFMRNRITPPTSAGGYRMSVPSRVTNCSQFTE